jgi:hypothetical protein
MAPFTMRRRYEFKGRPIDIEVTLSTWGLPGHEYTWTAWCRGERVDGQKVPATAAAWGAGAAAALNMAATVRP